MRPSILTAALVLALSACRTDPKDDTDTLTDDTGPDVVDADGDGYLSGDDCDDGDADIHPGADETCNGLDDDCDGEIDEEAIDAPTWYADADGDGWGYQASPITACEAPNGYVDGSGDCDDADPESYPDAPERCDGIDNDCDGEVDEDLIETWYADADADGFGNPDNILDSCDPGEGWVEDSTDCDDDSPAVNPEATELCNDTDDDCDGDIDEELESSWYGDADADGYGDPASEVIDCEPGLDWVENGDDCDDTNSDIHPDAIEICDSIDNDCDGLIDDADDSITGTETWYLDNDGDGYGDDANTTTACVQPSGYAAYGGDCDDADAAYNPGALEEDCTDPADYNCDGSTGYADDDADGWADCEDCDDSDPAVNPDATESCNSVDDDCDGTIDEDNASDADTWYADADADGYGDSDTTTNACDQPSGYVAGVTDGVAFDCDDSDAAIFPGADERCNGYDDDCDGDVDEDDAIDAATWYADTDADGYGDASSSTVACSAPSGHVSTDTDCDDSDAAISPAGTEICNGVDDDCDGSVDEGATDAATWYADADGDGYGDATISTTACSQPSGHVADGADCDDGDTVINPGASEACDGIDNDCDGDVDEDSAVDATTWYADTDADGYGASASGTQAACSLPSGYSASDDDCDDSDSTINPAGTEICNAADDDCDGVADDGVTGSGSACAADSCEDILADGASGGDGDYWLTGTSGDFETHCDMTRDGGGWTFIGSVVNEGSRGWNSEAIWLTDSATFGTVVDRQAADSKIDAYWETAGWDLMIATEEYAFGFYDVLGDQNFQGFLNTEYDASTCSQTMLASGADWYETMSAGQASLHALVVRPLDDNAGTCFPSGNENAILGFQLSECCWANGLGNTPAGYPSWQVYDNSLLELSRLSAYSCSAGAYPCNDLGYTIDRAYNCYDSSCKVTWAEMYVR